MKKILLILILGVIATLFAFSCGDNYDNAVIDINKLANDILTNIAFDDQLIEINEANFKLTYNFGEYVNMIVFAGGGATAEEIIIIETADIATADKIYQNVDTYYKNKKFHFKDYNPNENYKLNDPIFERIGKYVIYCISPETDRVKTIINSYLK